MRRLNHIGDWLQDALRFFGALLYWNLRKSFYILRNRRGACPCHDAGDFWQSPGRIRCDAAALWNQPARFRHVCPLLRSGPGSVRFCSASPAQVRPFWGRALASYGALLGALYLMGCTLLYVIFSLGGHSGLRWLDVADPARWSNITRAQTRYFDVQAAEAFARQELPQAYRSLQTADSIGPDDYDRALLLMLIDQHAQSSAAAEFSYNALLRRFPAERRRSAIAYHDSLLATGRMTELAEFSLRMLGEEPQSAGAWLRSLVLALRLTVGADKMLAMHATEIARLDPAVQRLLQAEALLEGGQPAEVRRLLARPLEPPGVIGCIIVQFELLLCAGDWMTAVALKNCAAPALGRFDALALDYWAAQRAGNPALAQLCFQKLTSWDLTPPHLDRLAALLVYAPDRELAALLSRRAQQRPDLAVGSVAALWIAAVVCDDRPSVAMWAGWLRKNHNLSLPETITVDFASRDFRQPNTVPALLGLLPLPRETILALSSQMQPRAAPAAHRGRGGISNGI